uniref:protein-serine/threonine phosphatase n=1 Tax=Aplanochytrium stocchinoi TaxID=215587 RepID=A0A7S3PPP7_9STRA
MGRECRSNNFMHEGSVDGAGKSESLNDREREQALNINMGFPAALPPLPTVDMGHIGYGTPINKNHMALRALALSPRSPELTRHWDSFYPPEPPGLTMAPARKNDFDVTPRRMPAVDEEDDETVKKEYASPDATDKANKSPFDWSATKPSANEPAEELLFTAAKDSNGAADASIHKTEAHPSAEKYLPPHLRQTPSIDKEHAVTYAIYNEPETPPLRGTSLSVSDDDIFGMDGASRENIREIGVCADQGHRRQMEDFDVTITQLVNPNALEGVSDDLEIAFHAVYDGHGGKNVAQMAAERIHVYAASNATMFINREGAKKAVTDAFIQLESEILDIGKTDATLTAGCCALVALLKTNKATTKRTLAIANLGDSRAVLCRDGKAVDLTKGHCPGRTDERERIEKAGGWVTSEKEMVVERIHHIDVGDEQIFNRARKKLDYVEIFRVNGELAVSRALGDVEYKLPRINEYPYWLYPPGHPGDRQGNPSSNNNEGIENDFVFSANLVVAEPEWTDIDLSDDDEFLILACDGVWEVMDSEEAVQTVIQSGLDAQIASENLVNTALRLGSTDNVTAIVVNLRRKQ